MRDVDTPALQPFWAVTRGPVYVEAGEELWLSVSKNQSDAATFDLVLNGYLIDVP